MTGAMATAAKVIGVIPSRFGASRFPGKPLAKINDKEMILHVLAGAKSSKLMSELFVATDDERIAQVVKDHGGQVLMTPADCPTGSDRIWAAVKDKNFDIVVNIQGDEPLVTGELIDSLVEPLLKDRGVEMGTLAHPLSREELVSENSVKVIVNQHSQAIYFSRFAIPYSRESVAASSDYVSLKHIGLYAYRKDFLKKYCAQEPVALEKAEALEQLRALYMGAKIHVVKTDYRSWGVDVPEDIKKIESLMRSRHEKK